MSIFFQFFRLRGHNFEFSGTGIVVFDVEFPALSNGIGFKTIGANAAEIIRNDFGHFQIRQFCIRQSIQRAKLALENPEDRSYSKIDFSRFSKSLTCGVILTYFRCKSYSLSDLTFRRMKYMFLNQLVTSF